jgi:hypothetical protein
MPPRRQARGRRCCHPGCCTIAHGSAATATPPQRNQAPPTATTGGDRTAAPRRPHPRHRCRAGHTGPAAAATPPPALRVGLARRHPSRAPKMALHPHPRRRPRCHWDAREPVAGGVADALAAAAAPCVAPPWPWRPRRRPPPAAASRARRAGPLPGTGPVGEAGKLVAATAPARHRPPRPPRTPRGNRPCLRPRAAQPRPRLRRPGPVTRRRWPRRAAQAVVRLPAPLQARPHPRQRRTGVPSEMDGQGPPRRGLTAAVSAWRATGAPAQICSPAAAG